MRYADSYRETYGGLYLDHPRGGKLCVKFTDQVEAHADRLGSIVFFPSRLLIERCQFTEIRLFAVRDRVTSAWDALAARGAAVRYLALNPQRNRVVVAMFPLNDVTRKAMMDLLQADYAAIEPVEVEQVPRLQAGVRPATGPTRAV